MASNPSQQTTKSHFLPKAVCLLRSTKKAMARSGVRAFLGLGKTRRDQQRNQKGPSEERLAVGMVSPLRPRRLDCRAGGWGWPQVPTGATAHAGARGEGR